MTPRTIVVVAAASLAFVVAAGHLLAAVLP
jgi:preprotein translocase subunit Sec61beta